MNPATTPNLESQMKASISAAYVECALIGNEPPRITWRTFTATNANQRMTIGSETSYASSSTLRGGNDSQRSPRLLRAKLLILNKINIAPIRGALQTHLPRPIRKSVSTPSPNDFSTRVFLCADYF